MFIALSTFTIANDTAPDVKEAFLNRPHLVDDAPGFEKLEVLSPRDNPNEIWLMTFWTDEESFKVWYKSHQYQESHKGIPHGLKLVPGSVQVRYFDHVSR
ncbi:antibiotic biosynthesis monooxygenase family protein [Botryobacter ruber]|uniref:antibiotic biosynthesis monooxygenase family protein n=1 Tax=Botryobacter ruber TaxID=2171629 RepID=UPI000E0B3652|nr:antibiotic biosynthesis monooxygenase [Botryobacter ruber]